MLGENRFEDCMINKGEKLANVTFENETLPCIVEGNLAAECAEAVKSPVRSLTVSTGVRIVDKPFVELGVQHSVDSVMKQSVPHGRFMNITRLGIIDFESMVATVPVGFRFKFSI